MLSAAEEQALAEAIARGDRDARTRMIQANLRLVVRIARDYVGRGMVLDDLIGEGNLGPDPRRRGVRPAVRDPVQHLCQLLDQAGDPPRPDQHDGDDPAAGAHGGPADQVAPRRAVARPRAGPPAELRRGGGLPRPDRRRRRGWSRRRSAPRQLRLENGGGEDGGSWSPDESSDPADAPDAAIEADDERQDLLRRLERLDERERAILALRFGLEGELPLTLKEVGRRLGVTREWVRKIEIRAVRKLDDGEAPEAPACDRPRGAGRATARRTSASPLPRSRADGRPDPPARPRGPHRRTPRRRPLRPPSGPQI